MQTFKDAENREWKIRLTAWECTRVREATGVELWVKARDDGKWDWSAFDLPLDPRKFLDVIWTLIEGQAKTAGLTREQFEQAFDADVYEAVKLAFGDEVVSFSPMPAALKAKVKSLIVRGTGEEPENRPNDSTSNESVTNWPGLSGSTPDPLPTVN